MTRDHAGLAAGAFVEMNLEPVLFPGPGSAQGDEILVKTAMKVTAGSVVLLRELLHRRQPLLILKQERDQIELRFGWIGNGGHDGGNRGASI
jgi:hypothetical protein